LRIIIASPPRSGNHWIKCLLGTIYGLEELAGGSKPGQKRRDLRRGGAGEIELPDGTIYHTHQAYGVDLVDRWIAMPAHVVTMLRDPYDLFVSYHRWVQEPPRERPEAAGNKERRQDRPRELMSGKPIDHPDTLAFLADGYDFVLRRSRKWIRDPRVTIVRYEDLHEDPVGTLRRLTGQIDPVGEERIRDALEACSIENMRAAAPHTVKTGKVGSSREQLTEEHLRIFRERHAEGIAALGYAVR
jgi:hypothetical protein